MFAGLASAQMASDEGLEITGLVLDETKTKAGRDFFDYFNIAWVPVPGLTYTIHIAEQPDRARGSFIKVLIDENLVFFQRLNPSDEVISGAAKSAVQTTRVTLLRRLLTRKQLDDEAP